MSVCSDPCMVAADDRGVMRIRIAGDPDTLEWPYSCPLPGNSNLQRDPSTGCLWVDPITKGSVQAIQGDFSPGVSLSGGATTTVTGVANLTIINPDPCRNATALCSVWMGWTFDADFDPSTTYGGYIGLRQITGTGGVTPVDGGFVEEWRNSIAQRMSAEFRTRTTVYVPSIAPGGSATVNVDMRGQNFQGAVILSRVQARITALVASI